MTAPTPTQPPQGVMAPAEALAVLDAEIARGGGSTLHGARNALAIEIGQLAVALRYACSQRDEAESRASALLARCEGLEAERDIYRELHEAGEEERSGTVKGYHRFRAAVKALDSRLAATRTTGGQS